MNSESQESYSRYFVRRVTKELIEQLVPGSKTSENNSTWGAIQEGAAKIGMGVMDVVRAALFIKKPDINLYPKSIKNGSFPNTYGFFIVSINQGKVTVDTDPATKTIAAGSEIFLVADLVGLPLARITGQIEKSILDINPGQSSAANYAIDLWLDPGVTSWSSNPTNPESDFEERKKQNDQRVGRFIQSFMAGRNDLTIDEFCNLAKLQLSPIINRTLTLSKVIDAEAVELAKTDLQSNIVGLLGLGSAIYVRPGSRIFRHQVTIDENTIQQSQEFSPSNSDSITWTEDDRRVWKCASCKTENELSNAFCEECGSPRPSGVKEASQQNRLLLSADGEQLVFDLSFISFDQAQVNYDSIAVKCLEILRPFCRKFPIPSLTEPGNLNNIASLLDREFGTGSFGPIGEFSIIDFRGADSDWQLQTRAKIKEQLRNIKTDEAEIEVAMAGYALREAQLVSAKKDREVRGLEAREYLETQKQDRDISLESRSIDVDQALGEHRIDAKKDIDIEKINRDVERERRKLDREDYQESVDLGRSDQLSQASHEMDLEKTVLRHDINKEQLLYEAQQLKQDKDLDFEEKAARLRASRGLDISKQEQELELERKRKELELELSKSQVDQDNQLRKLQMMAELERQQKEQFKGMSPAQILAMQATSLAQNGAGSALEKLASADAEKEREMAEEKTRLYERMLEIQSNSQMSQLDIMKTALNAQKESTDKVLSAHEKSVDNSEKWNEKSIDAMAKVATAVANKGNKQENKNTQDNGNQIDCPECGAQVDKNAKFCGSCGSSVKA